MKFTGTFERAQVDVSAYMRTLDVCLRDALAHGMFEYLQAVLARIPTWSGASRATFMNLAREISLDIPIVPVAWSSGKSGGILNRIPLGEQNGTGRLIINASSGQYHFEYTTDLKYLAFNEYHDANAGGDPGVFSKLKTPGPYNFQGLGEAAFLASARGAKLPSPFNHLKISVLRVGSRTII
jgi:hypothetical protein